MAFGKSTTFVEPPSNLALMKYDGIVLSAEGPGQASMLLEHIAAKLTSVKIADNMVFNIYHSGEQVPNVPNIRIMVSANGWDVTESTGYENRTQCPKGKIVCGSDKAYHYTVSCRTRTATAAGRLTASNKEGGAIFSKRENLTRSSKVCSGEGGGLEEPDALLSRAANDLAESLIGEFTPHNVKKPLDLVEETKDLDDATNEKMKQAYRLAAGNDIQSALAIYKSIFDRGVINSALYFNAGLCEQALGNFQNADSLYAMAVSSGNTPEDEIKKYRTQISDWLAKGVLAITKK